MQAGINDWHTTRKNWWAWGAFAAALFCMGSISHLQNANCRREASRARRVQRARGLDGSGGPLQPLKRNCLESRESWTCSESTSRWACASRRKVTPVVRAALDSYINENISYTRKQLKDMVAFDFNIDLSTTTISRTLCGMLYTVKQV